MNRIAVHTPSDSDTILFVEGVNSNKFCVQIVAWMFFILMDKWTVTKLQFTSTPDFVLIY